MIGEQLHYDSFYKFVTSVGIALVVLPLILLNVALSHLASLELDDLQVSQNAYDHLYSRAQVLVDRRLDILDVGRWPVWFVVAVLVILGIVCVTCLVGGILCIRFGIVHWREVQHNKDLGEHADTEQKVMQLRLAEASNQELLNEMRRETGAVPIDGGRDVFEPVAGGRAADASAAGGRAAGADEAGGRAAGADEAGGRAAGATAQDVAAQEASGFNPISESIDVERKCLDHIESLLGSAYKMRRGMRLDMPIGHSKVFFDAVAQGREVPGLDVPDIVVEVMYVWNGADSSWLQRLYTKLDRCANAYRHYAQGSFEFVILIVCDDENYLAVRRLVRGFGVPNLQGSEMNVQVITREMTGSFAL